MTDAVVATYSIVACDLDAGQWGVATQSKFLAVGSVVPWAEANVGAISDSARMRLISNTERLSSSGVNLTERGR